MLSKHNNDGGDDCAGHDGGYSKPGGVIKALLGGFY